MTNDELSRRVALAKERATKIAPEGEKRMRLLIVLVLTVCTNAIPAAAASPAKQLFAVFYWWYPYYGAQWLTADGALMPTERQGDTVRMARAGLHPVGVPIPFLLSEERPDGRDDEGAAVRWYVGNLARATEAGIDVLLLPARPDLPLWHDALTQIAAAQDYLAAGGHRFPRLAFMLDGIEYWERPYAADDLTHDGARYRIVGRGVASVIAAASTLGARVYRYGGTLPLFVYRVEGGDAPFVANDWWLRQLRHDLERSTGERLYLVLDELWCGYVYGGRTMATCAADNWFLWGANVAGKTFPDHYGQPRIANITVGFSGVKPSGIVTNPQFLTRSPTAYASRWRAAAQADWIILETWNFVEEDSQIDVTAAWGDLYIRLTAILKEEWA